MPSAENLRVSSSFPERIGRYELLLPIGTGGMATVYLARVRVVDDLFRYVALKLMHPHLRTEDGTGAWQLVEEAKLAASIRHPNVVPVLEVGEDAHGVFLVMEYVEGDTLSGIIRAARAIKAPLPPPIAARILGDALMGLHAAHESKTSSGTSVNLVHRDFSPQNILVGTDGISRLTDFGIAKVSSRVEATASGVIKGKVGYMAPEQALGKKLDRRCDVWAAGVVAWELLAMRRLYGDQDQVATLLQLVSKPPPRIRSIRSDVPEEVDEAIAQALQIVPEERCPNALVLRQRLLDAWKAICPIADATEVSDYVRNLVEKKLEKRRFQADSVIALREKISDVSERAIRMASVDGYGSGASSNNLRDSDAALSEKATLLLSAEEPLSVESNTTTGQTSNLPASPSTFSKKGSVLVGAAIVLVLALGIFLFVGVDPFKAKPSGSDAATATSAGMNAVPTKTHDEADAMVVGEEPLKDAASDVLAVESGRDALIVRSSVPMTGLRVGNRTISLVSPTKELELRLSEAERDADLQLVATARDGRRASVKASASETTIEMRFPAFSGTRTTAKPPPGLAPTPYEQ